MPDYPYTPSRGRLKGHTFESAAEYTKALADLPEPAPESDQAPGVVQGASLPRQRKGKVDKAMVYAIVFPINVGLYMLPQTRQDALTDEEADRLCEAVVKVAAVNKHVEKAIVQGAQSSAYVELAVVVGAIAVRRAAIHGYLPRQVGEQLGAMGFGQMPEQAPQTANVETNGPLVNPIGFPDAYATNGAAAPAVGVAQ